MEFMGQPTEVLVCNNKVASALTSLSNYLLLKNEFTLDSYDAKRETVVSYLERCISRRALDRYKENNPATAHNKAIVLDFFYITKRLKTGIEVNPVAGTTAFDASRELQFFNTLGVPLLHAPAFSEQVFPTLQEQLQHWQIAILYLNKEFNTICKYNGTVYMLVEDEVLHRNNPSACWKTVVNQKDIFLASDFSYITVRSQQNALGFPTGTVCNGQQASIDKKLHKCSRCLKEFCTDINYVRHVITHVPAYKDTLNNSWNEDTFVKYLDTISDEDAVSILSDADQIIEKAHRAPVESIIEKWILGPDFLVTPPEVRGAVKQLRNVMGMERKKPPSNVLLGILKVGSEGTFMSTNLLKGSFSFVEADKTQNTMRSMLTYFSLRVEEILAKKWYDGNVEQADVAIKQLLMGDNDPSQGLKLTSQKENVGDHEHKGGASIPSEISTSSHVSDDVVSVGKVPEDEESRKLLPSEVKENRKLLPSDIFHLPTLGGEYYYCQNYVSRWSCGTKEPAYFDEFHADVLSGLGLKEFCNQPRLPAGIDSESMSKISMLNRKLEKMYRILECLQWLSNSTEVNDEDENEENDGDETEETKGT
ncbi:unnamed protein product [Urochloa humidicola]